MLALPTEKAKGLRGVAGSPAARSLGISLPVGLHQCDLGDTGQSGQPPCPSAAWPGFRLAKTDASCKNTSQERSQLGCRQLKPETVNRRRGRAGPPTVMRSALPPPIPAPILLQPSLSLAAKEPKLRVRAAADKIPARPHLEPPDKVTM